MSSQVNTILNILNRSKDDIIPLMYETYRTRFNTSKVPPVKVARNKKEQVTMVWIDRLVALNWLKTNHEFLTREELHTTLKDISNDCSMD